MNKNYCRCDDLLSLLTEKVFGKIWINKNDWHVPEDTFKIGRQFFQRRWEQQKSINNRTIDNLLLLYNYALNGNSVFQPDKVCNSFLSILNALVGVNLQYLRFAADDTEKLRAYKINAILDILSVLLQCTLDKEELDREQLAHMLPAKIIENYKLLIKYSKGTTEGIVRQTAVYGLNDYIDELIEYGITLPEIDGALQKQESNSLEKEIWYASQRTFLSSLEKNGRFHGITVIADLLPKGINVNLQLPIHLNALGNSSMSLKDFFHNNTSNISLIGEGGIGKTTFLQHILLEAYTLDDGSAKTYTDGSIIPVFIELNRCPETIQNWVSSITGKSNFITRYIAHILENHSSLETVEQRTIEQIEKDMQKIPSDGKKKYLLLLDGFNEVRMHSDRMVRSILSHEIQELRKYPNVRIITTSRQTQEYKYAETFQGIYLTGLENADITAYLTDREYSEAAINQIVSNTTLMNCLRVPLYLCMFSSRKWNLPFLPETAGEILNLFFHKNTSFYNIKKHAEKLHTNAFSEHQAAFIMNFIIPYIGWHYEKLECFSVNKTILKQFIMESLSFTTELFKNASSNPYPDFEYDPNLLWNTGCALINNTHCAEEIIDYICNYLGIFYRYQTSNPDFTEKYHYSFIHHNFRDYFSAMWDIQLLSMLRCISATEFLQEAERTVYCRFLDNTYWSPEKAGLISQILMEHHSKPQLNEITGNWYLPAPVYDEQQILSYCLDFCRKLNAIELTPYHLLNNILTALHLGRGELSGMDLSGLDLRKFNLFGIVCSKKGATQTLAADFGNSSFSLYSFVPENHQSFIEEHIYCGNYCYTIDSYGIVKCWDILSGKMEYEIIPPSNFSHFTDAYNSSVRHLKVSKNGKWIALRIHDTNNQKVKIAVYDTENPSAVHYVPEQYSDYDQVIGFDFTEDSSSIYVVYDKVLLFCYSLEEKKQLYYIGIPSYNANLTIYAKSAFSDIYFIGKSAPLYYYYKDVQKKHIADEASVTPTFKLSSVDQVMRFYSSRISDDDIYVLAKLTIATGDYTVYSAFENEHIYGNLATFLPGSSCFVYYDSNSRNLLRCNCNTGKIDIILEEITIADRYINAIYAHPDKPDSCYIVLYDMIYEVVINPGTSCLITARHSLEFTNSHLSSKGFDRSVYFSSNTVPCGVRFLVKGRENRMYEWNCTNNQLTLKYNPSNYETAALIPDHTHKQFLLIHRTNGVSVFSSHPYRLINYFHFEKTDYIIEKCCYHEQTQQLAIALRYINHRKIIIQNLHNSQQTLIYETHKEKEAVKHLCFNETGAKLLIIFQYSSMEYHIADQILASVSNAGKNECYVCGNYSGNTIEVAIDQDLSNGSTVMPRCEQYILIKNSDPVSYYKRSFYYLPEITDDTADYFLSLSEECGGISYKENPSKINYVYKGFLLNSQETPSILHTQLVYETHGHNTVTNKRQLHPLSDIIYTFSKNHDAHYQSSYELTYLSSDRKEGIIKRDLQFSYCPDLMKVPQISELSSNSARFYANPKMKTWIHLVSWEDDTIIGCRNENRLFTLPLNSLDTDSYHFIHVGSEIKYSPGIAIYGCNFSSVHCDDDIKKIIHQNGGLLDVNSIPEDSEEYSIHKYLPPDIERTMKPIKLSSCKKPFGNN